MSLHRLRNIRSDKKPTKNERKRPRTITGMRKDEVPKWDNIVNRISRRTISVHKRNERREKWQISECFHSRL